MRRPLLGALVGLGLGVFDGLSGLSALAAAGQPEHYWAIVLPGMLLGVITGFVTQRFGRPTSSTVPSLVAAVLLLSSVTGLAQAPELPPDLAPLKFFIGKWTGTSEGQPGKGTAEREYKALLRARVVELTNRNVYPPQPTNAKGETHEDMGIFSFDRAAKKIRFRQFHVEGFVVAYASVDTNEKTLAFVSDSIENIPNGYRSKETYVIIGPDEFEEVFELAEPGKDFQVYSRTRLKRVK
jgi:hypothetical protein